MSPLVRVAVADLRKGDTLPGELGWTAIEDASPRDGTVELMVVHTQDGGTGRRVWDDPTHTIQVDRTET